MIESAIQGKQFCIKTANRQEVEIAIDWAGVEGWNPGLYDADCYYAADPQGFLIGFWDTEPIATLSVVKYSDAFGFMGFYIVKPDYRGQGYGLQIWNAGLQYLEGCTIGLDGVVTQQENYQKSGFKLAFRNVRYEGMGGGEMPTQVEIIQLSSLPDETLADYSQPFFPADRSAFLKTWINQPECIALGILERGKLAGYGVLRKCRLGYKIGPLFADRLELAELLFLALKSPLNSSDPIYLDVPEGNLEAIALVKRHTMNVVFETARMYRGTAPDLPIDRIFGITSFEIG